MMSRKKRTQSKVRDQLELLAVLVFLVAISTVVLLFGSAVGGR